MAVKDNNDVAYMGIRNVAALRHETYGAHRPS